MSCLRANGERPTGNRGSRSHARASRGGWPCSLWLRRFTPFSQALLLSAIVGGSLWVLFTAIAVIDSVVRGMCQPVDGCGAAVADAFFVRGALGLPVLLASCVGHGLTIWSSNLQRVA